jgi:hypothetical protein
MSVARGHRLHGMTLLAAALVAVAAPAASGCSVPVFRYALERWAPSPYELRIFHRGPLDPAQQRLADELDAAAVGAARANFTVQWLDVAAPMDDDAEQLWRSQAPTAMPWMVLGAPAHGAATGVVRSGPATAEGLAHLLASPARTEVARRLVGGDTCVWLFVASGDPGADAAARERLRAALADAEHSLELPAQDPRDELAGVGVQHQEVPLRISFPVLGIARDDAAEAEFVALLTATFAPTPPSDRPFVVAVCGQGRGVEMLSGDEIEQSYIAAVCRFVTGACACEVKAQMPGSDLLMTADWRLGGGRLVRDPEMPDPAALAGALAEAGGRTPVAPAPAPAPAADPGPPALLRHLGWWAAGAALGLAISTWLVLRARPGGG